MSAILRDILRGIKLLYWDSPRDFLRQISSQGD
jgi:hypothetical protein